MKDKLILLIALVIIQTHIQTGFAQRDPSWAAYSAVERSFAMPLKSSCNLQLPFMVRNIIDI